MAALGGCQSTGKKTPPTAQQATADSPTTMKRNKFRAPVVAASPLCHIAASLATLTCEKSRERSYLAFGAAEILSIRARYLPVVFRFIWLGLLLMNREGTGGSFRKVKLFQKTAGGALFAREVSVRGAEPAARFLKDTAQA